MGPDPAKAGFGRILPGGAWLDQLSPDRAVYSSLWTQPILGAWSGARLASPCVWHSRGSRGSFREEPATYPAWAEPPKFKHIGG